VQLGTLSTGSSALWSGLSKPGDRKASLVWAGMPGCLFGLCRFAAIQTNIANAYGMCSQNAYTKQQ